MKVARILSSTEVAITIDKSLNIKKDDNLEIMDSCFDEIVDPVTKKSLGGLPVVKEIVTVVQVFENFCLAKKKIETPLANVLKSSFSPFFVTGVTNSDKMSDHLNIDASEIEPRTRGKSSEPIHVGDTVLKSDDKK